MVSYNILCYTSVTSYTNTEMAELRSSWCCVGPCMCVHSYTTQVFDTFTSVWHMHSICTCMHILPEYTLLFVCTYYTSVWHTHYSLCCAIMRLVHLSIIRHIVCTCTCLWSYPCVQVVIVSCNCTTRDMFAAYLFIDGGIQPQHRLYGFMPGFTLLGSYPVSWPSPAMVVSYLVSEPQHLWFHARCHTTPMYGLYDVKTSGRGYLRSSRN